MLTTPPSWKQQLMRISKVRPQPYNSPRRWKKYNRISRKKLFSTGGSLSLKKRFWYLISWRWEPADTATIVRKDQSEAEIKMPQGYKLLEKVTIWREECDIAQRTLDFWLNPAGKMTHEDPKVQIEFMVRLGQAQDWATAIINSNLNRKETHMAYHSVLQAKIWYALAVTTFTKPQLRKIQRTSDVAYRPKIRLNKNFPNVVVQGPPQYCGLTQPPFYIIKGSKQLQLLISTIRNKDDTGDLTRASLELEQ